MKKVIPILLLIMLLLCGCIDDSDMPTTSSEAEPEVQMLADMSFRISGYNGIPKNILINNYKSPIYFNGSQMERTLDTPLTILINESGNNVFVGYDKLSGIFYNTCEDKKGIHEKCIWTSHGKIVYRGTDRIFFVFYEDDRSAVYSCDFYGENITKLYQSDYSVEKVVQEGEYIYFLESGIIDGETIDCVYRLNLNDLKKDLMISESGIYYFMPIDGDLLYKSPSDNNHYIYKLKDKSSKFYADETVLPYAFFKNSLYFEQDGYICRRGDGGLGETEYLFEGKCSGLYFTEHYIYRYVHSDGVYRYDYGFNAGEFVFSLKDYKRSVVTSVSDEMLVFTYSIGEGSSKEIHLVVVDLKTKDKFDAILS